MIYWVSVVCEHRHLPKARQVELKARIIAMTAAVKSTSSAKRMLQQMQAGMTKWHTQLVFFQFCYDFGGPTASWKCSDAILQKNAEKGKHGTSVLGHYFRSCWFQNLIFVSFWCVHFYACFWHRFREASGSNLQDFVVISGSISISFSLSFRRCCNTQRRQPLHAKCLVWDVMGICFWICLIIVCMCFKVVV